MKILPKDGRVGRRGLPEWFVLQMYNDYLQKKSLRAVGKIYGRSNQNLHEMFARRGWRMYEKIHKEIIEYQGERYTPGKGGYMRRTRGVPRTPLHVAIWIDANGPVPSGKKIVFKDNDKRNFELGNLACMTQKELSLFKCGGENQHTKRRQAERVEKNMGFIVQKAQWFHARYGTAMEDLIAAGLRAIVEADKRYKAGKVGASGKTANFLTFASHHIRSAMQRCVGEETGAIRTPSNVYYLAGSINQGAARVDAPIGEEGDNTLGDLILSQDEEATGNAERAALLSAIEESLADMEAIDQRIVKAMFWEGRAEREIAMEFGISRSAINQRLQKIKRKLRFRLRHIQREAA